jgi:uncharacterized protein YfaP (DUF2135 family)
MLISSLSVAGCKSIDDGADDAKKTVEDAVSSEVKGRVTDNRGQAVAGVTVRLYDLLDNTSFVEGSDLGSLEAYIDREAVLASNNDVGSAVTDASGRVEFEVLPSAFLAVATKDTCSAGFAGFDEETGVLNLDTLIKPRFKDGLSFSIPTFEVACAEPPPEVGPEGNNEEEAPPFEPEMPPPTCDAAFCAAAGGECEGVACVITCVNKTCAQSGGSCVDGECVVPPSCNSLACAAAGGSCQGDECVTPACNAAECATARGTCSADGNTCEIPPCFAAETDCTAAGGACSSDGATCQLPACSSDEECEAAQPGSWCSEPGNVAMAKCEPPEPGEITPPMEALGWTEFRITDQEGKLLVDASDASGRIAGADLPEDGIVRIYAKYSGAATDAFVQVQSGGSRCAKLPPRTGFIDATIEDGVLTSSDGDFVELVLHGGCQKVQLSTSNVLGQGERSFTVDSGDRCAPPRLPFIAILTWKAGRRAPADLDLNVWNAAGELVHVGRKQARWGRLWRHGRGPGPEVFASAEVGEGPFTVKVQFFSGRPREVEGKLRILRTVDGRFRDETFRFVVRKPKDVAEIGVFPAQ